jgi:hypothetical protein
MENIVIKIKQEFEKALESKTGWGKNEIKTIYSDIVIQCLSEYANNNSQK